MKYVRHKFLALLCVIVVTSCLNPNITDELQMCESIMEEQPDSSYYLLQKIDTFALVAEKDIAKYNLLITQARTKLGFVDYSDTLINVSTRYFSRNKQSRDYMKSLFYQGNIAHNRLNLSLAIKLVTQAYEIASALDDKYWIAKTSELMSDIYSVTYNNDEMIKYTQIASDNYLMADKRLNHLYSQCDLATAYANEGKISRSISIIDSVHSIAQNELKDTTLLFYCCRALFPICVFAKKHERALQCVDELSSYNVPYSLPAKYIAYQVQLEFERGNRLLAHELLKRVEISSLPNSDKAAFYWTLSNLCKAENDYKEAINYSDSILKLQNKELDFVLRQATTTAQRDLYNEIAIDERDKAKRTANYILVGVIAFAIIFGVALWVYHLKLRMKNIEIEKNMSEILVLTDRFLCKSNENIELQHSLSLKEDNIKSMSETIVFQQQRISSLNEKVEGVTAEVENTIENLFKDKWQMLNMLCNEFFERGDSARTRASIINNIDAEITKLRSPKNICNIEMTVNKYMNNIVEKLKEQCPMLKPDDIVFIMLVYAGFSPRAVCLFTGIKLKYFYTKKSRLIQRILSSSAPDKDIFAQKLS